MKRFIFALSLGVVLFFPARVAFANQEVPNGSFEDLESTVWECDLNCTIPVNEYFTYSSSIAADGWYYLYIFHDAGVYQTVTIPADAATLTFWFDNQPDDTVNEEGVFILSLVNPSTNEIYVEQTVNQQSDSWLAGSVDIPASLLG